VLTGTNYGDNAESWVTAYNELKQRKDGYR